MTEGPIEAARGEDLPQLHALASSFYMGLLRLGEAGLFARAALAAAHRIREHAEPHDAAAIERLAPELRDGHPGELDAFSYLDSPMALVYATGLLDAFLSDVARFLFLRFPSTLDGDDKVEIKTIRAAADLDDIFSVRLWTLG